MQSFLSGSTRAKIQHRAPCLWGLYLPQWFRSRSSQQFISRGCILCYQVALPRCKYKINSRSTMDGRHESHLDLTTLITKASCLLLDSLSPWPAHASTLPTVIVIKHVCDRDTSLLKRLPAVCRTVSKSSTQEASPNWPRPISPASALDILALRPTLLHKTVSHEFRAIRGSIVNLCDKMEENFNEKNFPLTFYSIVIKRFAKTN